MSHKESIEMPLTAKNVAYVISTKRAVYVQRPSIPAPGLKSSKKEGLPGILRLIMLASEAPIMLSGFPYLH